MSILHNQITWEKLAQKNPFWAILTKKKKWNKESFFLTGQKEINFLFNHLRSLSIKVEKGRVLDFGCGVGRLTQALCPYFKKVVGVDISTTMILLAKKYNRYKNCKYIVNRLNNLSIFPDNYFSFIFSDITLQHIEPALILDYIKEFIRILKKDGVCVFQLPSHPANNPKGILIRLIPEFISNWLRKMEMHGITKKKVIDYLIKHKARIINVKEDVGRGTELLGNGWVSYKYYFSK